MCEEKSSIMPLKCQRAGGANLSYPYKVLQGN